MLGEINYILFNSVMVVSFVACAVYIVFFFSQREGLRKIARMIFLGSGILQSLYILSRYFLSGYTPITSQHEAVVFFAWSVTWAYLSFHWRYSVKNFGTFVSVLVVIMLCIAASVSRDLQVLSPILQSLWLPVHAGISVIAYGFLALAFCGGIMYLLQERELKTKNFGFFYSRLPSLESLDQLNNHCLTVGFVFLTLGIITGTLWGRQAWGTYWSWDPKETWSLITWLLYAAQIHQRFTLGWRGRRIALMSIVGFCTVLFTLWGVTFLLGGVHTYAQ